MPRTEQAFGEMRERSSKKILEAAKRVFAKKGLAATVADIAAEAGVSQGLAYRYFPSKEAIFHTLLRQMLQSGEADRFAEETGRGPRERLERFVTQTIRLRREHPEFYRFVFQALAEERIPKDIHAMMNAHGRDIHHTLVRLVKEGQARNEISKGNPDELVDVILSFLEGLSMRLVNSGAGEVRVPDAKIVLRVLGPESEGRKRVT